MEKHLGRCCVEEGHNTLYDLNQVQCGGSMDYEVKSDPNQAQFVPYRTLKTATDFIFDISNTMKPAHL